MVGYRMVGVHPPGADPFGILQLSHHDVLAAGTISGKPLDALFDEFAIGGRACRR